MSWSIDDITTELATHTEWAKRIYWWSTNASVLLDSSKAALCRQAARLARSMGIGLSTNGTAQTAQIDAAIDVVAPLSSAVEWCIVGTPYHYVSGSAPVDEWGTPHDQDVAITIDGLEATLEYLVAADTGKPVGMIYYDTEIGPIMPTGSPSHDRAAAAKIELVYRKTKHSCQEILGYQPPVVWYTNLSRDLGTTWRNNSVIPPQAPIDYPNCALFQWEDPHLCVEIYNRSLVLAQQHGFSVSIPTVSLCSGYVRDLNAWQNAQSWPTGTPWVTTSEYPRVGSWLAGNYMHKSAFQNNDAAGLFESAPFGFFWPGMLPSNYKYWALHLLAYSRGANGIATVPTGEPV